MAKNPIITDKVETLIADIYRKHPKWKAPKIRNEVSNILTKENPNLPFNWPSLSSVQKVLAIVRKQEKITPHNPLDEPWSFGMLKKYEMAQNAVDSLVEVWKYGLAIGHVLTVREALWAARLDKGFKDAYAAQLLHYALLYSDREIVSELLGKESLDTRDLDAEQWLRGPEHALQRLLDTVPQRVFYSDVSTLAKKNVKIARAHKWQAMYYTSAVPHVLLDTTMEPGRTVGLAEFLPTPDFLNDLTDWQDRVFAAVLLLLSKGPKWKTLSKSPSDFHLLMSEVKQCVIDWTGNDRDKHIYHEVDLQHTINPELLRMVGYEINTDEGGSHERINKKKRK